MYKFKNSLIVFTGLLALMSLIALVTPRTGAGQNNKAPQDVRLVGTAVTQPVRDVDNPVRQAIQLEQDLAIPDGVFTGSNTALVVPGGKRLVIEFASGTALLPAGQKMLAKIQTSLNNHVVPHTLALTSQGNFGSDVYCVSQQTRIYADPGSTVTFSASRNGNAGDASLSLTISGYLVDVP